MCYDNVFIIIVWDFIKNARKLQKLQLHVLQRITSIYPNEKSIEFQKLGLNPSIVATRKVKWCKFNHYFD